MAEPPEKISPNQVVQCLLVMVQHGIVNVKREPQKKPTYAVDPDAIHFRVQHTVYVRHIKERFKDEGEILVEALCRHGKLTQKHLLDIATKSLVHMKYTYEQRPEDDSKDSNNLKSCLKRMIKLKYLRRADTLQTKWKDVVIPTKRKIGMQVIQPPPVKKSRKISYEPQEPAYIETYADESLKFRYADSDNAEVFWQLNHPKFMFIFRNRDIGSYVKHRVDKEAQFIVREMLNKYPIGGHEPRPSFAVDQIRDFVKKLNGVKISREGLKQKLTQMTALKLLVTEGGTETSSVADIKNSARAVKYLVNIEGIIEEMKLQHAQSIVKQKFGVEGARIFRLVYNKKRLEEKQVAVMATLEKRIVRGLLQNMLCEGFSNVQDVPKDSSRDHTRMMFLWTVNFVEVCKTLMDRMYFTWVNLDIRW
uniref:DNA-directed RNA polymerase III subunit RPC3 n=2 Tax=Lotharella globosa TaxID=91324 RepID=A0A7S3YDL3_9EUKA